MNSFTLNKKTEFNLSCLFNFPYLTKTKFSSYENHIELALTKFVISINDKSNKPISSPTISSSCHLHVFTSLSSPTNSSKKKRGRTSSIFSPTHTKEGKTNKEFEGGTQMIVLKRKDETQMILSSLTSSSHFWYVISPPCL